MGPIPMKWNVSGWPTLVVVDHGGVIRHRWLGNPGNEVIDEALTARVYAAEPYASQSRQWMRNASDGIFRSGGRQLLLSPEPDGQGYAAAFDIGLQV